MKSKEWTCHIHPSAPANCVIRDGGYEVKSLWMIVRSFGWEEYSSGRGFRESAMREVILGLVRARERTSWPMKPLAPASISFISI